MRIFPFMKNICSSNWETMICEIDGARKNYDKQNKIFEMTDSCEISSIEQLLSDDVRDGVFRLHYKGIEWNCFVKIVDCSKLTVLLNGSRPAHSMPVYKRWSWADSIGGVVLIIDDPMCVQYPQLMMGWYYGRNEIDYIDYVLDIVNVFKKKYEISRVEFYASSGGGAAAIRAVSKMDEAIGVFINPQIFLEDYSYSREFISITKMNLGEDILHRNNPIDLITNQSKSRYMFIENIRCQSDYYQLQRFSSYYGVKEIKYGVNKYSNNVLVWTYDAEGVNGASPHSSQEWIQFWFVIDFVKKAWISGRLDDYEELVLLFNELWRERYDIMKGMENK